MITKNHVIYFDVDGTLTDNVHNKAPKSVMTALNLLKRNGYKLCLSTGRRFTIIPQEILNYSWDSYVCMNGQLVYNKNVNLIYKKGLDSSDIQKCIDIANRTNTSIQGKTLDDHFIINFASEYTKNAYRFFGNQIPPYQKSFNIEEILCLMVFRDMQDSYDDFKKIEGINVFPGMSTYADINAKGANKYTGIQKSLETLNKRKYIGIGDSLNDYDMLVNADIGIAMGNAPDKLKEISNFITDTPENDGILKAAQWILKNNID